METLYTVELNAKKILIIREALEELKRSEYGLPQWQHELIGEAMTSLENTYEKPKMAADEMKAEVEKDRKFWEKEGGSFLGVQMARAKEIELRFFNEITGEGI